MWKSVRSGVKRLLTATLLFSKMMFATSTRMGLLGHNVMMDQRELQEFVLSKTMQSEIVTNDQF